MLLVSFGVFCAALIAALTFFRLMGPGFAPDPVLFPNFGWVNCDFHVFPPLIVDDYLIEELHFVNTFPKVFLFRADVAGDYDFLPAKQLARRRLGLKKESTRSLQFLQVLQAILDFFFAVLAPTNLDSLDLGGFESE